MRAGAAVVGRGRALVPEAPAEAVVQVSLGFEPGAASAVPPQLPAASPEAVVCGGKRLRGAIDLVEFNDGRGTLRVTDHKTGLAPRSRRLAPPCPEVFPAPERSIPASGSPCYSRR